jgi:kumamolisin
VLACGGTRIEEPLDVVWNEPVLGQQMASGGGMSGFFPRPDYQSHLQTPPPGDTWQARQGGPIAGRWIPDVAANAAFSTGYELQLGGKSYVGGGTSAATPLWAGLIALAAAHAGTRLGHINRHLYRDPSGLRSVTHGQNDLGQDDPPSYHAATGWDPCTGLGIPDGRTIVDQLKSER